MEKACTCKLDIAICHSGKKNSVEAELLFIKCEKILENLKENFRKMWKYIENARKLLVKVTDVHYNKISVFNLGGKSCEERISNCH